MGILETCSPCQCPSIHARDTLSYRTAVLEELCNIIAAVEAGGGGGGGGTVTQGPAGLAPWLVDGSGVVQPVSATNLDIRDLSSATDSVTVTGAVVVNTISGFSTEATLAALNAKVTAVNTGAVVVSSSALPAGAATEATLSALNTKVIAVNTGAVTVAASALPTGAATEATLSALNTKVTAVNTGAVVLAAGTANVGLVVPTPGTTGGWSKVKYAAQTTTVQTVKGTAGNFGGYYIFNPNSSVAYVQIFDAATATSITLGTTVPDMVLGIPGGSAGVAANLEITCGVNMTNGIKLAVTTTALGLTAPAVGLDMTIFYK